MSTSGYAIQSLANINAQIAVLQSQVALLQGQVASLTTSVTNNTMAIAILQGQIVTIQGQISTLQSQVTTLQDNQVLTVKISLTSAQILTLNTVPVQLLAAPGAGKIIEPLEVIGQMNFGGTAYSVNVLMNVLLGTSAQALYSNGNLLTSTATRRLKFAIVAVLGGTTIDQYPPNSALNLLVLTGNPALGNGTLDIYVTYKIVTL